LSATPIANRSYNGDCPAHFVAANRRKVCLSLSKVIITDSIWSTLVPQPILIL
jgi:hypothetical protein